MEATGPYDSGLLSRPSFWFTKLKQYPPISSSPPLQTDDICAQYSSSQGTSRLPFVYTNIVVYRRVGNKSTCARAATRLDADLRTEEAPAKSSRPCQLASHSAMLAVVVIAMGRKAGYLRYRLRRASSTRSTYRQPRVFANFKRPPRTVSQRWAGRPSRRITYFAITQPTVSKSG